MSRIVHAEKIHVVSVIYVRMVSVHLLMGLNRPITWGQLCIARECITHTKRLRIDISAITIGIIVTIGIAGMMKAVSAANINVRRGRIVHPVSACAATNRSERGIAAAAIIRSVTVRHACAAINR